MSKEKIESRRAFMKKLGKTAATVAGAAAFMAVAKTVEAALPDPTTGRFGSTCSVGCLDSCYGQCTRMMRG